ncbi:hypothetical protein AGLY_001167 [Aphis glycines]|uniref:Trimethylguanosine synthase n=1 Tax=Aphis glycines TaxID=307491 RepID=A0A6G0U973_APHGL|nr:hypothetical protein AGLY_001167 [Aphis glycines]
MTNLNFDMSCKYEVLAEISFHADTSKDQYVKLLCSRLLARCYLNKLDTRCTEQLVSNKEDECSIVQKQFTNLSTNESQEQQHAEWYAYWEKNGEQFVNETWIKLYENYAPDDLPTDIENVYKKHTEQQYQILYWKFINEMCPTVSETTSENSENDECILNHSKELITDDCVSNFDFLYKYKNFQRNNSKLSKAYRAISIMGYIYNDQDMFDTGFVQYLKKNIIKSTRHLNVYRFPKTSATPIFDDNLLSNSKDCVKNKVKNKKVLKKEEWKDLKEKYAIEEMDRLGYSYLQSKPKLLKFWKKRYMLFSKFEKGIKLDEESWYSVTPEIISTHIAERCSCYLIVDPFCGAGSNIIQFAKTCELVIAIDIDPKKIEIARHNAELYGVADRIQFIIGDFFALAPTLKADVVFLSPPWGGPDLMNLEEYKLSYIIPEKGGVKHMMSLTRKISSNIALHLPKNTNIFDCIQSAEDGFIEVQQNMLNSRYNSLTVYYSELYGLCDEDTVTYNDS